MYTGQKFGKQLLGSFNAEKMVADSYNNLLDIRGGGSAGIPAGVYLSGGGVAIYNSDGKNDVLSELDEGIRRPAYLFCIFKIGDAVLIDGDTYVIEDKEWMRPPVASGFILTAMRGDAIWPENLRCVPAFRSAFRRSELFGEFRSQYCILSTVCCGRRRKNVGGNRAQGVPLPPTRP